MTALRIHRLALAEIDHEVAYYEARQTGLGAELEDALDAAFSRILRFPKAAREWQCRSDCRVLLLARFPFAIPYQITDDDIIVLALAHTSRRPGYWLKRGASA